MICWHPVEWPMRAMVVLPVEEEGERVSGTRRRLRSNGRARRAPRVLKKSTHASISSVSRLRDPRPKALYAEERWG